MTPDGLPYGNFQGAWDMTRLTSQEEAKACEALGSTWHSGSGEASLYSQGCLAAKHRLSHCAHHSALCWFLACKAAA